MDIQKYDKNKWKKIMDTTQINYSNMIKRLKRKSKISNFTLIYYSIFLIVISLTCKYFPNQFNCNLAEYFNLILSIIILAYSLINNNANYNIRIINVESSLNKLKNIKRRLDENNLEQCINEYNEITDKTERREDVDFFITVRQLNKKYSKAENDNKNSAEDVQKVNEGKKAVNDYLSEINEKYQILKLILEYLWYICLVCIPIAVFIVCIIV